jgi:hypothetical protein
LNDTSERAERDLIDELERVDRRISVREGEREGEGDLSSD